jgi:hypothetical protein
MNYLAQIKSYHKGWYYAALLFAAGSIGANVVGIETTPFFVWGMFSQPETPQERYSITRFYADDKQLDYTSYHIPLFQRYFMTNPLYYAQNAFENHGREDVNRAFLREKLGAKYQTLQPIIQRVTNNNLNDSFNVWQIRYVCSAYGMQFKKLVICPQTLRYANEKRAVEVENGTQPNSSCK